MTNTDIAEGMMLMNLRFAKDGDSEAEREFLGYVSYFIENDRKLPAEAKQYVSEAFRKIADGARPEAVLLKKRRKYAINKKTGERYMDIQMRTAQDVHNGIKKGLGKHKAEGGVYAVVGEKYEKDPTTIENIYKEWKEGLEITDEINRENDADRMNKE